MKRIKRIEEINADIVLLDSEDKQIIEEIIKYEEEILKIAKESSDLRLYDPSANQGWQFSTFQNFWNPKTKGQQKDEQRLMGAVGKLRKQEP